MVFSLWLRQIISHLLSFSANPIFLVGNFDGLNACVTFCQVSAYSTSLVELTLFQTDSPDVLIIFPLQRLVMVRLLLYTAPFWILCVPARWLTLPWPPCGVRLGLQIPTFQFRWGSQGRNFCSSEAGMWYPLRSRSKFQLSIMKQGDILECLGLCKWQLNSFGGLR